MASKRLDIDAAHAQSLGMVSPIEGLAVFAKLMCSHVTIEVWGAATALYWKVLLRGLKERPAIFANLYVTSASNVQVDAETKTL